MSDTRHKTVIEVAVDDRQIVGLSRTLERAFDDRSLDRFEGHPFAYERVVKLVLDEHGQRRRATTYLQPEDGFEPWAPQPGYFRVLWRAYARLGFDVAPLATAAGVEP